MPLRDASELLYPAVQETLAALGKLSEDSAARKLAQSYARAIDQASEAKRATVLWHLGPELLKVLAELGATPAARAVIAKGTKDKGGDKPKSQLEVLREARGRRA